MYGLRPQVFSWASTPVPISKSDASTPSRHTLLIMDRLLRATRRAVEIKQQRQDQQGHNAAHHQKNKNKETQQHKQQKKQPKQKHKTHRHHYGVEDNGLADAAHGLLRGEQHVATALEFIAITEDVMHGVVDANADSDTRGKRGGIVERNTGKTREAGDEQGCDGHRHDGEEPYPQRAEHQRRVLVVALSVSFSLLSLP